MPFEVVKAFLFLASATAADGIEVEVSVVAVLDLAFSLASIKVESETFGNNSWGALALAGFAVPDEWLGGVVDSVRAVFWLALNGTGRWVPELVSLSWGSLRELARASVSVEVSCDGKGSDTVVVKNVNVWAVLLGADARARFIIPFVVGWAPLGKALAFALSNVSVEVESDWAWLLSASALTSLGVVELSARARIVIEVTDLAVLVVEVLVGVERNSCGRADALVSLSIVVSCERNTVVVGDGLTRAVKGLIEALAGSLIPVSSCSRASLWHALAHAVGTVPLESISASLWEADA